MANRAYDQYCTVAVALDVVGDRWTLLILRELLYGPRRFTDLRTALPGIAPNLLTERLRHLEAAGLVEQRELPPPAARTVYAATPLGRELRPVLQALGRFGLHFLPDPDGVEIRPERAVFGALTPLLDPVAAADLDLVVHLELDGSAHALHVLHGSFRRADDSRPPDVTLSGETVALVDVCRGKQTLAAMEAAGRLQLRGTRAARRSFERAFGLR